jgi:hypothetical protein
MDERAAPGEFLEQLAARSYQRLAAALTITITAPAASAQARRHPALNGPVPMGPSLPSRPHISTPRRACSNSPPHWRSTGRRIPCHHGLRATGRSPTRCLRIRGCRPGSATTTTCPPTPGRSETRPPPGTWSCCSTAWTYFGSAPPATRSTSAPCRHLSGLTARPSVTRPSISASVSTSERQTTAGGCHAR